MKSVQKLILMTSAMASYANTREFTAPVNHVRWPPLRDASKFDWHQCELQFYMFLKGSLFLRLRGLSNDPKKCLDQDKLIIHW